VDREQVRAEIRRLQDLEETRDLSPAESKSFDKLIRRLEAMNAGLVDTSTIPGQTRARTGNVDTRTASRIELRDAALKVLDAQGHELAPRQIDHVDRLLRSRSADLDGAAIARRLLITETEAYRSAFTKGVTEASPLFTDEERQALTEYRAMDEGTPSAGGFGVPVLIDPTIILTSGASDAPLLNISRVVTITTDAWHGVSSQGVSWSYDAEASAVSDDSPTLAQPTIPVYMARGFVPYSYEVGMDYPGFADEMSMVLNQGFIDLLASQTMVGSGSNSPTGIFTAMANTTTNPAHIVVTTTGVLGAVDVRTAWASLPERFRPRATWVMSPTVEGKVRAFGNGLALSDFTVNLLADGTSNLTGRPVVISDYAPAFTGTTGAENYAVVGDFSNFVIAQRAGMSVELVPQIFDTSTGRPTGQRGWFAYARHGFSPVTENGFRLIANS
jgi:HK97 family phage major capsid protein